MRSLTQSIKNHAYSLGFDLVGITTADDLPEEEKFMHTWLAKGYAGKMEYLHRHAPKKAHPKASLPEAKSVIVLGVNYYSEDPPETKNPLRGKISRYARGADYHDLIQEKVKKLETFIQEKTNSKTLYRHYVDTGPLFEKALAQRAGLGFIGKNTLLLTKGFGSWIFLAELLLDRELDYDLPATGSCGECRLCVDACPTNALNGDYTMDGSLCIAYHTIELKEEIPDAIRPKIGNLLFGCDICQEVCPYTRRAKPSSFQEKSDSILKSGSLDILELLKIRSDEEFKEKFKNTPLLRSKRQGLLRNAAVVAGNSQQAKAIPLLKETAQSDPAPLVRSHATWALQQVKTKA